jgi:Flp pilus assembly pilin Flp
MALLVVAAIAALGLLGGALSDKFNQVTVSLQNTM